MPLVSFQLAPGLVTEATARGAEGRWKDADKVRFRKKWPEKLGGWRSQNTTALDGVPRGIIGWQAIDGLEYFGIATSEKLLLRRGGTTFDITPYRVATSAFGGGKSTITDPFTTTSGSDIVEVNHSSHGIMYRNTWVEYANANNVGGLDLNGEWQVTEVVDGNNYKIQHDSAATSDDTGGGTVDYAYQISAGPEDQTAGFGYGAGTWGQSTYGTARATTDIVLLPRLWSLDTWGEDFVANPRGGGIYRWQPPDGTSTRASEISNAPAECNFILVSGVDRHLIALGCTPVSGGGIDPLTIRWADQNDIDNWTPDVTNTASERRLDDGSRIVSAIRGRREHIIFTDTAVFTMSFVGPPTVFSIRRVGKGGGIASPQAMAEYGGLVFWMGLEDFYIYDGRMQVLDCPVRNHVFDDLNRDQASKITAGVNSKFTEIWWFYPSADSQDPDRYVIYNFYDKNWTFGTLNRTAWTDRTEVSSVPFACSTDGFIYAHETGNSDDGDHMAWFLESYDLEMPADQVDGGPGGKLVRVKRLIPDFFERNEDMTINLKARKYPNGQQITRSVTLKEEDDFCRPRIRGRQVAVRMEGESSQFWRSGAWRIDIMPHGDR
jgi:hypothetical protein